jgi:hypothetical protein
MSKSSKPQPAAWLLLVFTLPTAKASERVGVWRKLQRYGAVALPASGYVLPNTPVNLERFEWLAASIRGFKGQAAVAQVCAFDELKNEQIELLFNQARTREYQVLERELQKLSGKTKREGGELSMLRIKRRLQQIVEVDFFGAPTRTRIEEAVRQLEGLAEAGVPQKKKPSRKDFIARTWITRPQPGIDRVSSAWLIRRYIDGKARFIFNTDPKRHPRAVPFDMFNVGHGFGHSGNDCTFETLMKCFNLKDPRLRLMA